MAVGKTKTISVSNIVASAVIAVTDTRLIIVGEDPSVVNWPTQDFKVLKPGSGDVPRQIPIGGTYIFQRDDDRVYLPGEVAGYVQATTGVTTFFQDERGL